MYQNNAAKMAIIKITSRAILSQCLERVDLLEADSLVDIVLSESPLTVKSLVEKKPRF